MLQFSPHMPIFPHAHLIPTPGLEADLLKKLQGASSSFWLLVSFLSELSSGNQMLPLSPPRLGTALDSAYHLRDKPLIFPH